MSCNHHSARQTKILRINGDRYQQVLEYCRDCRSQTIVRITELKKGDHRDSNH